MSKKIAKRLGYSFGAGVFAATICYGIGEIAFDKVPNSEAKIAACASTLGSVATDSENIDVACKPFKIEHTDTYSPDPITGMLKLTSRVFHEPSQEDFPTYAEHRRKVDTEQHSQDNIAAAATAFTLAFAPLAALAGAADIVEDRRYAAQQVRQAVQIQ